MTFISLPHNNIICKMKRRLQMLRQKLKLNLRTIFEKLWKRCQRWFVQMKENLWNYVWRQDRFELLQMINHQRNHYIIVSSLILILKISQNFVLNAFRQFNRSHGLRYHIQLLLQRVVLTIDRCYQCSHVSENERCRHCSKHHNAWAENSLAKSYWSSLIAHNQQNCLVARNSILLQMINLKEVCLLRVKVLRWYPLSRFCSRRFSCLHSCVDKEVENASQPMNEQQKSKDNLKYFEPYFHWSIYFHVCYYSTKS